MNYFHYKQCCVVSWQLALVAEQQDEKLDSVLILAVSRNYRFFPTCNYKQIKSTVALSDP